MRRFRRFARQQDLSLVPRLNPVGPYQPVDLDRPPMLAYLGGRPVLLTRTEPSRRGSITVPLSPQRYQRAIDLERGYAPGPFIESSLGSDSKSSAGAGLALLALALGTALIARGATS